MARIYRLAVPSLLFAAARAAEPSPPPPPRSPGVAPDRPATTNEQAAVALGVSIASSDDTGAPRLMRALRPRASAAGMLPAEAARDHVTALAPLWIQNAQPAALVEKGT